MAALKQNFLRELIIFMLFLLLILTLIMALSGCSDINKVCDDLGKCDPYSAEDIPTLQPYMNEEIQSNTTVPTLNS